MLKVNSEHKSEEWDEKNSSRSQRNQKIEGIRETM